MHTGARARDPQATRTAILDAAEQHFARKGYAGTSMRELAAATGISQPLIHHYFGSKEQLYAAVKQQVMERYVPHMQAAADSAQNDANSHFRIASEIVGLYRFLEENKTLLKLAAWTRLEGDNTPWPRERELIQTVCDRIRKEQSHGTIRADIQPLNLTIMIIGVVYYWLEYREYYKSLFSETAIDDDAYLRQSIAVLAHGTMSKE